MIACPGGRRDYRIASIRERGALPFRSVNRRGVPGYDPSLQRHHLLPKQLLIIPAFNALFDAIGRKRIGFEDFRRNGLLLPAQDQAVARLGLPLHRGPHRHYNGMVIERVGQIETRWQRDRGANSDRADEQALMQLALLQQALRRRLLKPKKHYPKLNRKDPLGSGLDFRELDAMADKLWIGTQPVSS